MNSELPPPRDASECVLKACAFNAKHNDCTRINLSDPHGRYSRSSNIELLRIVAMSMILIGHILTHGLKDIIPWAYYVPITTFCACGVNLFFMISGYFGIKLNVRSIFKFIFTLLFFETINIMLLFFMDSQLTINEILSVIFFPVSKSPYWFLQVYFLMLICSPVINLGLKSLPINRLRVLMVAFSFVIMYSCGIGHNISNPNGYTFLQGMYMYMFAYYIRNEKYIYNIKGWVCFPTYLIVLVIGAVGLYYTHHTSFTAYNSIINILASILLFVYFSKLKIESRLVNVIASASLGCYLLQDGLFGIRIGYEYICNIYLYNTLANAMVLFLVIFVSYWLLSFLLSQVSNTIHSRVWNSIESSNMNINKLSF